MKLSDITEEQIRELKNPSKEDIIWLAELTNRFDNSMELRASVILLQLSKATPSEIYLLGMYLGIKLQKFFTQNNLSVAELERIAGL